MAARILDLEEVACRAVTRAHWLPLRAAWERALYGATGFYRSAWPVDHFRTSPLASPLFAQAIAELAGHHGLTRVWDVGAGGGELLQQLHACSPRLGLAGVELRDRPAGLPSSIGWMGRLPAEYDGLVLAHELLDNIACDVVETDSEGVIRIVEVDLRTSRQRLGEPADEVTVDWLTTWWPVGAAGQRAEIGTKRETLWASVCAGNRDGLCIAVDYGHLRARRPRLGSLAAYREGGEVDVTFDGSCDISAGVAVDALAAAVGGTLRTQRESLGGLGVDGGRPPLQVARDDPPGYLRRLAIAAEAAELTASPGLGDFWWLLTECG